nr:immunoglobulin light chain junction region [Macaca mulatta]
DYYCGSYAGATTYIF